MKQLIPFNQSIAGNIHNFCLDNVRRGYGIDNNYASAWEAWEHTQQHTDPIPEGLDVPLFYSYTANIDGVTANYGHINVRLADGTVWSDGTIYPNLDAYLTNHWPKYVGWGESVNDFKIIETEGDDMLTPQQIKAVWNFATLMDLGDRSQYSEETEAQIISDYQAWGLDKLNSDLASGDAHAKVVAQHEAGVVHSPAPPISTPGDPSTPIDTTPPPAGQGTKSLLQIITDFLSSIIIGKKG